LGASGASRKICSSSEVRRALNLVRIHVANGIECIEHLLLVPESRLLSDLKD